MRVHLEHIARDDLAIFEVDNPTHHLLLVQLGTLVLLQLVAKGRG